jgi:hypothetical protein
LSQTFANEASKAAVTAFASPRLLVRLAKEVREIFDQHELMRRQGMDLLDQFLLAALSGGRGVLIRSGHAKPGR